MQGHPRRRRGRAAAGLQLLHGARSRGAAPGKDEHEEQEEGGQGSAEPRHGAGSGGHWGGLSPAPVQIAGPGPLLPPALRPLAAPAGGPGPAATPLPSALPPQSLHGPGGLRGTGASGESGR